MLFEFSNQILAAKLNLEKPKKEFVSSKIVTDSRKISKGDCFLALKGPNFNGHDFIDEALDRGASFIISEKNHPQDEKILGVNSTHECLSFLAKYNKIFSRLQIFVINFGITFVIFSFEYFLLNDGNVLKNIISNFLK